MELAGVLNSEPCSAPRVSDEGFYSQQQLMFTEHLLSERLGAKGLI